MRWVALGVDYEMSGKDLIDSVRLSGEIARVLGADPPVGFTYELFLDAEGRKVSKSRGNGLTVDEWLAYGTPESLALFMYNKPREAKRLRLDVVPRLVDEHLGNLARYETQDAAQRLGNPAWHVHAGAPPPAPRLSSARAEAGPRSATRCSSTWRPPPTRGSREPCGGSCATTRPTPRPGPGPSSSRWWRARSATPGTSSGRPATTPSPTRRGRRRSRSSPGARHPRGVDRPGGHPGHRLRGRADSLPGPVAAGTGRAAGGVPGVVLDAVPGPPGAGARAEVRGVRGALRGGAHPRPHRRRARPGAGAGRPASLISRERGPRPRP